MHDWTQISNQGQVSRKIAQGAAGRLVDHHRFTPDLDFQEHSTQYYLIEVSQNGRSSTQSGISEYIDKNQHQEGWWSRLEDAPEVKRLFSRHALLRPPQPL
jgi:hypothetical protein